MQARLYLVGMGPVGVRFRTEGTASLAESGAQDEVGQLFGGSAAGSSLSLTTTASYGERHTIAHGLEGKEEKEMQLRRAARHRQQR